ncbi:MAG: hypothetical protein ACYTGZ_04760 [Planctomycetota bacterium]
MIHPAPIVELTPSENGWSSAPVKDELNRVSNNGLGYTGEIDVYEFVMPADGRLQISLDWDHDADFDLVLASDPAGQTRLVEGIEQGPIPEYIGTDVTEGQQLWLFVAGWEGDPGEYTLETILLRPGTEPFALESLTDGTTSLPRNAPIEFVFTQELDPEQEFLSRIFFYGQSGLAPGHWCIDGRKLTFYPRLPNSPGDTNVMEEGFEYLVQFPRAARGLRAVTGEYLDFVDGAGYRFRGWADPDPSTPPRVVRVDLDPSEPWDGSPVTVELLGALDPATIAAWIELDSGEVQPTIVQLSQQYDCSPELFSYLQIEPASPLPAAARVHVYISGNIRRLGGDTGATGPAPASSGAGFAFELWTK